jgi:hypothetical protein
MAAFPAERARKAIIRSLATDAIKRRVGRLVIEHGDHKRDRIDRQEIGRVLREADCMLPHSHDPQGTHEGLEIADLGAWTYGAGGHWRTRAQPIVGFAHRVDLG